ncbi:LD-carboxypeptidase [Flavobacteriaceae bacterium F08102]|nr:LD-carboxypeptidase [Flavobacteriaceae bacterium F08102]
MRAFLYLFLLCLGFQSMFAQLKKPPYLQKGDTVMIIAPAGIMKDTAGIENGIALLNDWGLTYILGKNLYKQNFQFAGTDEERLADVQEAFDNPTIKAIWCARGGYGAVRIIDDVDFTKFKSRPKWMIGFSDITVFHNELHNLGFETLHALMPLTYDPDERKQKRAVRSLKRALFGKKLTYRISESPFNKEGEARGELIGGNLSIVYSMLGSKSSLDTQGKILFIEDVGEAKYHIDRMLISLRRAGYFDGLAGLIVGGFNDIKPNSTEFGKTVEEIVLDAVKEYDFPVSFDFPSGHITDNRTLILGRTIDLKVKAHKAIVKFED